AARPGDRPQGRKCPRCRCASGAWHPPSLPSAVQRGPGAQVAPGVDGSLVRAETIRRDVGAPPSRTSSHHKELSMLYAILCYKDEAAVGAWSKDYDATVMADLQAIQKPLVEAGKMGPVARLLPTTAATTVRKGAGEPLVLDGPFAENKEQFL